MKTLTELRRELKKIDCNIKVKRYSDSAHVTYVFKSEEIHGNVFSAEQLNRYAPLIDFINEHKDSIAAICREQGLSGYKKFMR